MHWDDRMDREGGERAPIWMHLIYVLAVIGALVWAVLVAGAPDLLSRLWR